MSLVTGKRLSRQQWDELPMPDGVIATVKGMAQEEQQPIIGCRGPVLEWAPGILIPDEQPVPIITEDEEHEVPIVIADNDNINPEGDDIVEQNEPEVIVEDDANDVELQNALVQENVNHDEEVETVHDDDERSEDGHGLNDENDLEELRSEEDDAQEVESNPRYNLRRNRGRTYDHRLAHSMDEPVNSESYENVQFLQQGANDTPEIREVASLREAVEDMYTSGSCEKVSEYITGFIMTQMTVKAGIKKHGQVAIDALYKEFLQLHDLGVFNGQHTGQLTKAQKKGALRAIRMIKEKRCGRIKGRTVADRSVQRDLYSKEETSSPTVSTDALMLSIMIDAWEHRDVATADVAGA
jgi:hypothetical protein